jgi:hypothetical protein
MKIRTGFVSNSSSSSFIISNKNNIEEVKSMLQGTGYDYYELNGKLYTSQISDCSDLYNDIYDFSDTSYDSHEQSYSSSWIDIEGELGCEEVYLPKEEYLKTIKIDDDKATSLLLLAKDFIIKNNIKNVYNVEDDLSYEDLVNFMYKVCEIVDYKGDIE